MKFDAGEFYEISSTNLNFHLDRTNLTTILREDLYIVTSLGSLIPLRHVFTLLITSEHQM
jgi:hypothetical protein